MKRLIILFFLIATPLFAQNRALRIDSLEINDKNVTGFFNDVMSPYSDSTFFMDTLMVTKEAVTVSGGANRDGADSSAWLVVDDGNGKFYAKAGDGDSIVVFCNTDTAYIRSNNPFIFNIGGNKITFDESGDVAIGGDVPKASSVTLGDEGVQRDLLVTGENISLDAGTDSCIHVWVDDGNGKIYLKAGDADSMTLSCANDSAKIHSNNVISMNTSITVWGTMSAQTVTDRSEYCSEKESIRLLKKVNLSTVDKFENEDDVFVLPYELRDRQYRSLSKCVSLLLAVAKSQQTEIEDLKKQIKRLR